MVRIKICGLTNLEDSLKAAELGADAVGFIFYGGSPRNVKPETVVAITDKLPPFLGRVGVFVGQSAAEIWEIVRFCGLDTVQLHGTRPPEFMGKRSEEHTSELQSHSFISYAVFCLKKKKKTKKRSVRTCEW